MDNNNNNTYYFNNLDDEYSYDLEVDALYIEKKDDDYEYSIEVNSKLIIDFNSTNDIIGLEMLDVSRILKIDEEEFINPKTVNIKITPQNNETYLMDMEINGQHLIIYTLESQECVGDSELITLNFEEKKGAD